MYSIESTVGGYTVVIHDDTITNPSVKAIDPVLSLEDNTAGTLEFKLAPNNVAYAGHTLYSTQVTGVEVVGSTDFLNPMDLEEGDINSSGEEFQNGSRIRTASYHQPPETEDPDNPGTYVRANRLSLTIDSSRTLIDCMKGLGNYEVTYVYPTGWVVVPSNNRILTTLKDLTYANTSGLTLYATAENTISDISWQPGSPNASGAIVPNTSTATWYTTITQASKISYKFYLEIDGEPIANTFFITYIVYKYVASSSKSGGSWQSVSGGSFASFNDGYAEGTLEVDANRRVYFTIRKTTTDLPSVSQFTTATLENTSPLVWEYFSFNDENECLGYGSNAAYIPVGTSKKYKSNPTQTKVRFCIRREDNSKISASSITSISYRTTGGVNWLLRYYDENHEYVNSSAMVPSGETLGFPSYATYYRAVCEYSDSSPFSIDDMGTGAVAKMVYQRTGMTVVGKTVDLVGRLTSTVKVYRDTLHTTLSQPEGSENSQFDLRNSFEQGWISSKGEFLADDKTIRLPLTTYPLGLQNRRHNMVSFAGYLSNAENPMITITDDFVQGTPSEDATIISNANSITYGPETITGTASISRKIYLETDTEQMVSAQQCTIVARVFSPSQTAESGWVQESISRTITFNGDGYATVDFDVYDGDQVYYTISAKSGAMKPSYLVEVTKTDLIALTLKWGLVTFDASGNILNSYRWIENNGSLDVDITDVADYSILLRTVNNYKLDPSDLSSAVLTVYHKRTARQKDEIWEGRVLTEDNDFYGNRTIKCEGELSYLNDTCQPMRVYDDITITNYFKKVIAAHNSKVDDTKKFYVGTVWNVDNGASGRQTTQYQKTLEIVNNLVTEYGGHLRIRKASGKRYIDWIEDYADNNSQVIQFGENLLDFSVSYNMSEMCTVLLPTGHVTQEAGSSSAGDELVLNNGAGPTYGQLLYQDSSTKEVYIRVDPALGGYKTAVAVVEPGKNYYFSGRLHGGLVAYVIKSNADGSGDYYDGGTQIAGREGELGFVDFIDQKIEIPAGAHSVVMCSFGNDIQLALKEEVEAVEGLDEYLTIEGVADDIDSSGTWHKKGSNYISNPETIGTYGWIEKQISLDDIEDEATLYKTAKDYLKNGQFDEMVLELTAIDMNSLGVDAESINLLDYVRVISTPHGIDRYFPVTKLEIPLNKPASANEQKFTLGQKTSQTLTDVNNDINEELLKKVQAIPSTSAIVKEAKSSAADLINTATTGYVIMVMDESTGRPRELVISDTLDYTSSTAKLWRWNEGGLGYSDHGYVFNDSNLKAAMTKDGAIVADRITTGTLRAIDIQGCTITAGTLDNGKEAIIRVEPKGGGSGTFVDLYDGQIRFGYKSDATTYDFYGSIMNDFNITQTDGSVKRGMRILGNELMCLYTPDMCVMNGNTDENGNIIIYPTFNGTIKDKDGNEHTVINGMITA